MQSNWKKMVDAWKEGAETVRLANLSRFCGAKTSIAPKIVRIRCPKCGSPPPIDDGPIVDGKRTNKVFVACRKCGTIYDKSERLIHVRSATYGQWVDRPIELSFHPLPKRERIKHDKMTLEIRAFPPTAFSTPYSRALFSPEARLLKAATNEILEQPDGDDFSNYGYGDLEY